MSELLLNVTIEIQSKRSANCGPASVKAILDYYEIKKEDGSPYSLQSVNRLLKTTKEWGCEEEDILGLFTRLKLPWKKIGFDEISLQLAQGAPILTLFRDELHDGHFAVIIGEDTKHFIFHDPWPDFGKFFKRQKEFFNKQSMVFDHWLISFYN